MSLRLLPPGLSPNHPNLAGLSKTEEQIAENAEREYLVYFSTVRGTEADACRLGCDGTPSPLYLGFCRCVESGIEDAVESALTSYYERDAA